MLDAYLPLARRLIVQSEPTRQISATALDALLAASTIRHYPAGHTLYLRGDPIQELTLALEGGLEVSVDGSDGRRSICWYLPPGQWAGLIPALDGKGAIHNLRTYTDTVLLQIPGATIKHAVQSGGELASMFLNLLCERSRSSYDTIAAANLLPLRARVAWRACC